MMTNLKCWPGLSMKLKFLQCCLRVECHEQEAV
jgi:hypothetical protein